MDSRFPLWLRKTLSKLEFIGIPNLAPLLCALAVMAFVAQNFGSGSIDRFVFDPYLVLDGEWWRLFTFPISSGLTNPLWLLFYVLYMYFVITSLEQQWGPGPTTVYLILGYFSALAGSFLTMRPVEIWYFILENISLAFGTLFPNYEMLLYFILPVKAKWLAMLAGGFILLRFFLGSTDTKILLACSLFPYMLFFGPMLITIARDTYRLRKHKRRFDKDMWR